MRLPFFRRRRDGWASVEGLESVRSLFSKFQRIQKLNTRLLELMAGMEQALGGEYIFDRAFLESSVHEMSQLTYQVVYSLNAMSGNRYVGLFDRFQQIKSILQDVLGGGPGPFGSSLALRYAALGWESEPFVGSLNVCLAQARFQLDLLAPDGFAVTTTGCRLFMGANGIDHEVGDGSSVELTRLLAEATLPPELEQAISREMDSLASRCTGLKRVSVRACPAGDSVEGRPGIGEARECAPEHLLRVCREVLAEFIARMAAVKPLKGDSVALAVHEAVDANVVGSIRLHISSEFPTGVFSITAARAGGAAQPERYWVRRIYPFDLLQTQLPVPQGECSTADLKRELTKTSRGMFHGSALVEPVFLKTLAKTALTIERTLGCMQELQWARGEGDRPYVLEVRPSRDPDEEALPACQVTDTLQQFEVLLRGGETVQTGISAGRAVHVSDDFDPELFPHGAVAVARVASPRLSPILRRAAGLVTEVGSSIGHLATVARELRVPGIFGAADALERIEEGADVTLDAGERTVYRGVVESLLSCRECSTDLYPTDPEYVALRRLLRWIMPLELIDPESDEFTSENCRTYHDIIHFAHERSVEELLQIQDRGRGLAHVHARKLELDVPAEFLVIDLGGGISGETEGAIKLEQVTSAPFREFLRGLTLSEMWSCRPASLTLRDVFSGLERTFSAMTSQPEYSGVNHAIVAANYMNLGLRLGYHFSVVDSYLGDSVNQNTVYFRFVGGFADERKRRLRVELIRLMLEEMRFKVMVKGDLVVGKLKIAGKDEVAIALVTLGQLTGFTRQLDLSMTSEEAVKEFAMLFKQKSGNGHTFCDGEEAADA